MRKINIVKGSGANCAYCNETPTNKFSTYSNKSTNYFVWACNEQHAKLAK